MLSRRAQRIELARHPQCRQHIKSLECGTPNSTDTEHTDLRGYVIATASIMAFNEPPLPPLRLLEYAVGNPKRKVGNVL